MTPFDFLKIVHNKEIKWSNLTEEDHKAYNTFIINKALSFNSEYLDIVNNIQKYTPTSKESFKYLQSMTNNRFKYNKWIKGAKTTKFNKDLVELVSAHFECSQQQAEDYLSVLDKKELKSFLNHLGIQDDQIKKLIKK